MCWYKIDEKTLERIKEAPTVDLSCSKSGLDTRIKMIKDISCYTDKADKRIGKDYLVILHNGYARCIRFQGTVEYLIEIIIEDLNKYKNEKEANFFVPITDK